MFDRSAGYAANENEKGTAAFFGSLLSHVVFARQICACPFVCPQRSIRCADIILEWGLLDLLRELTGIYENHPEQTWARNLYQELMSMCRAADFYNQHPVIGSRQHYMDFLKQNYDRILEEAVKRNSITEKIFNRRGKTRKGKIRALIDRLIKYKGEVCRFADNSLVPFSNNQAERRCSL